MQPFGCVSQADVLVAITSNSPTFAHHHSVHAPALCKGKIDVRSNGTLSHFESN